MSTYRTYPADLHDHSHSIDHDDYHGSSPVPEKWIPWAVMATAAALLIVAFLILNSLAP